MNQASFYCPHCNQQRLFQSTPMNHTAHILAAVFLCGLWLPIWAIIAIGHQDTWRCAFCGFCDAVKYLQNPRLREYEQIAAEQKRISDQRRSDENQRRLAAMPRDTPSDNMAYVWATYKIPILIIGSVVLFIGFISTVSFLNSPSPVPANSSTSSPGIIRHDLETTPYSAWTIPNPSPATTPMNVTKPSAAAKSRVATVISENANIRLTPDANGDVVDTLEYGATVEILKQKGAWFQVRYAGTTGWLHGNTIRLGTTY